MAKLIGKLLVNILTLLVVAYILPGFVIADLMAALVAAIVIGVINTFLKPVLLVITLPLTIMTFGLFALVVNVVLLLLAAQIVPGFSIDGFLTAVLASILLTLVSSFLNLLVRA